MAIRSGAVACILLGCTLFGGSSSTESPQAATSVVGRELILSSRHAPFPHQARANGYRYRERFFSYRDHYADNSILIHLSPAARLDQALPVVVYLHGWRNNVRRANREFRLIEQFRDSGFPGLLVVPQLAREAEDSFGGHLEDSGGFDRMIADVMTQLASRGRRAGLLARFMPGSPAGIAAGQIVLAGHSGAYRPLARLLEKSRANHLATRVRTVLLFDGLYGFEEIFVEWLRAEPGRRFVTVHTRFTRRGSRRMQRLIAPIADVAFSQASDVSTLPERNRWPSAMFLQSSGTHDECVYSRRQFGRLLRRESADRGRSLTDEDFHNNERINNRGARR